MPSVSSPLNRPAVEEMWDWLAQVPDPEIPVISLVDLGIVRDVAWERRADGSEHLVVRITPTYSGCPATQVIAQDVQAALASHGVSDAEVVMQLSPPWTTEWMAETAREQLRAFGIAPPGYGGHEDVLVPLTRRGSQVAIACPRCGATRTRLVSEFGSTPCKAHYTCLACLEPFDYFKPL